MKKILNIVFVVLAIMSLCGCKKNSYVAKFDQSPQERIGEQVDMVRSALTSAENGWIATLPTGLGGGYAFYMAFDNDENVTMYADMNDNTSSVAKQSKYRVKADAGADLVFDTYTYISLLNDPDPSAFGAANRDGFKSDIDFIYDHSSADSMVFIGKRYRQTFSLIKATAEQKSQYINGGYKAAINSFKQFFVNNPNAYFEIDTSGTAPLKVSVEPNMGNSLSAGKRLTFSAILKDETVQSAVGKFAFTLNGMAILDTGIYFNNLIFTRLAWKSNNVLALYDIAGKEYIIKNAVKPLLPLYKLWGSKYSGMLSDFKQIYPGTSAAGADILNFFHNNLTNAYTGYVFNYGRINFVWNIVNKKLSLNGFSSQNGGNSGWTTTSVYNYAVDENGVYTFTLNSAFSGGYVSRILQPMHNFLLANKVRFEYYLDGTTVYGQMISVTDPTIYMTFILQ